MEIKVKHVAIGLGAAALLCGLSKCPGESKGVSIQPEKVATPVAQKRADFGMNLRDVIEGVFREFEEEEEREFTVDVPLGKDGNIPEDFDFAGEIRDCIESSGELRCIQGLSESQSCFGVDSEELKDSVGLYWHHKSTIDSRITMVFSDGRVDGDKYEYDSHNPEETRGEMDRACNDTIKKYRESEAYQPERKIMLEYLEMEYDLFDLQDDFFDLASESGFEIKDEGGSRQTMFIDGEEVNVRYAVDWSRTVGADDDWMEPSVEVKIGEKDYFHNFPSTDAALAFIAGNGNQ